MSKQRISDSPETLKYLLNEKIPISKRLAEYNKYDCLAFIPSPGFLYPHFSNLVCGNVEYQKAFRIEKEKAIDTIQNKQKTLDYETFVKYLFNEIGEFKNKHTIHGTKENDWQETIIYDITPTDEQQVEILEKVSIKYAKREQGGALKKPTRLGKSILHLPFISLDRLTADLQESLKKPYADQKQVITDYRKRYLEPLQDTETNSKAQTIYRNFKTGKADNYKDKDYFYYATKGAVMELLEFEKYLGKIKIIEKESNQIKALFKFIEFLHSNIENFKQYDELIDEINLLDKQSNNLKPNKNFKDKIKYDKIQVENDKKFEIIKKNIIQPIRSKVKELKIGDCDKPETIWNLNISQISKLKQDFSEDNLHEIFKHKSQYIEFRTKTEHSYFQNYFFRVLDETLKELFNYFKETELNEFDPFQTKAIPVNSIEDAVNGFKQGFSITLPSDDLLSSKRVSKAKLTQQSNKTNIDELDFLLENVVDFVKQNDYNHESYKKYANDFCASFNRLITFLTQSEQIEIEQKIKDDFYLQNVMIVDKHIGSPDYEIKHLEKKYRQMKNLILKGVKIELKLSDNYQPKQPNEAKPDEVSNKIENPHPEIFRNNGFEVFERMHSNYKDKTHHVAHYSFLFYAMTTDELIHCSGIRFIEFLASHNVHIDRIDSRQSGRNNRMDYYNEIKSATIAQQ